MRIPILQIAIGILLILSLLAGMYLGHRLFPVPKKERRMHSIHVGESQSGKSTAAIRDIVERCDLRDRAMIVQDPHGGMAWQVFEHLIANGHEHRIIFDDLGYTKAVPGYEFLSKSVLEDPHDAAQENDLNIGAFCDIVTRERDINFSTGSPLIREWTNAALRLWLFQEKPVPLSWLIYALKPKHPVFDYLLKNCTDQEAVYKFTQLERMSVEQARREVSPALRLLEPILTSNAFLARASVEPFNFMDFLLQKKILIVRGNMAVSEGAVRSIMGAIHMQGFRKVKTHYGRTARELPSEIWEDEATNFGLIGNPETINMAQVLKMGCSYNALVQLFDFPDPVVGARFLSNAKWQRYFKQGSADSAMEAGRQIALRLLDPKKIKHSEKRERVIVDYYSTEKKISKSHGPNGSTTHEGEERVGHPRTVIDESVTFEGLNDQILLVASDLSKMDTGYCMEIRGTDVTPTPVYKVPLPDPCSFEGLAESRAEEALIRIRQNPLYQKPDLSPPRIVVEPIVGAAALRRARNGKKPSSNGHAGRLR